MKDIVEGHPDAKQTVEIATCFFGYDNAELLDLLGQRGDHIKEVDFRKT